MVALLLDKYRSILGALLLSIKALRHPVPHSRSLGMPQKLASLMWLVAEVWMLCDLAAVIQAAQAKHSHVGNDMNLFCIQ